MNRRGLGGFKSIGGSNLQGETGAIRWVDAFPSEESGNIDGVILLSPFVRLEEIVKRLSHILARNEILSLRTHAAVERIALD